MFRARGGPGGGWDDAVSVQDLSRFILDRAGRGAFKRVLLCSFPPDIGSGVPFILRNINRKPHRSLKEINSSLRQRVSSGESGFEFGSPDAELPLCMWSWWSRGRGGRDSSVKGKSRLRYTPPRRYSLAQTRCILFVNSHARGVCYPYLINCAYPFRLDGNLMTDSIMHARFVGIERTKNVIKLQPDMRRWTIAKAIGALQF